MADQEILITQFVSMFPDAPIDQAHTYLMLAEWNLEQAIQLYLGGLEEQPTQKFNSNDKRQYHEDGVEKVETLPKPKVLQLTKADPTPKNGFVPGRRPKVGKPDSVFALEPEPFRSFQQEAALKTGIPPSAKISQLASMFQPPFEITFEGHYSEAIEAAKKKGAYLLINIQVATEFPCQILNRDTWSDHPLKEFVKKNFLFWQGKKEHSVEYSQFHKVKEYPHIAVLDPRTGENLGVTEGYIKPYELRQWLSNILESTPYNDEMDDIPPTPVINSQELKQSRPVSEWDEDDQLAEAIKQSLEPTPLTNSSEADFEDEGAFTEDEDSVLHESPIKPDPEINLKKRKQEDDEEPTRNVKRKIEISDEKIEEEGPTIQQTPTSSHNVIETPTETHANIEIVQCTLKVKQPDGKFHSLTFPSNTKLQEIYNQITQMRTDKQSKSFSLTIPHPKKTFTKQEMQTLDLHQAGLSPRALLLIEND